MSCPSAALGHSAVRHTHAFDNQLSLPQNPPSGADGQCLSVTLGRSKVTLRPARLAHLLAAFASALGASASGSPSRAFAEIQKRVQHPLLSFDILTTAALHRHRLSSPAPSRIRVSGVRKS